MPKFELFAGLNGGFGGAVSHGIKEFRTKRDAEKEAYDLAWEEYESYGGNHGLLDWEGIYEDLLESEWIEPGAQSEAEIAAIVDEHYQEWVEGWIEYYVVEVTF